MGGDGYKEVQFEIEGIRAPLRCWMAADRKARRKGLSGTESLPEDGALLIPGAPVVHMVGMKYPLDLVFISPTKRIVKVKPEVAPGIGLHGSPFSWFCLEMNAGKARSLGFERGRRARW